MRARRLQALALAAVCAGSLGLSGCVGSSGGMLGGALQLDAEAREADKCEAGSGTISGSENLEKAYNYLISVGYSPEMAAGITGNLQTESGANPWIAEMGYESQWGWGVPAGQLRGWGIVQWTFGRHAAVRDYVVSKLGREFYTSQFSSPKAEEWMKPGDLDKLLSVQLDYLRVELEGSYRANVYEPMRRASTPEEAADIFVRRFEVPANVDATSIERQKQARALYDLYGKGTSGGSTSKSGATSSPSPGSIYTQTPSDGPSKDAPKTPDASSLKWSFPLKAPAVKTSDWGMRVQPVTGEYRMHGGVDLVPTGSDKSLYAVSSGKVYFTGNLSGAGNTVVLLLDNGEAVRYFHLSKISVKKGQRVNAGDVVGIMGATGGISTGEHLHFEVISDPVMVSTVLGGASDTVDPVAWLSAHGFNLDGSPNGKVPTDQITAGFNNSCAPGGGSTGSDMNPGPIPSFSASELAASTPTMVDNTTTDVGKANTYIRKTFPEVLDIIDYTDTASNSCHNSGQALDVMVPVDSQLGDTIAAWAVQNASGLNASVIIWKQQLYNSTKTNPAWRKMEDRGSITQNHRDHVHISFLPCVG